MPEEARDGQWRLRCLPCNMNSSVQSFDFTYLSGKSILYAPVETSCLSANFMSTVVCLHDTVSIARSPAMPLRQTLLAVSKYTCSQKPGMC